MISSSFYRCIFPASNEEDVKEEATTEAPSSSPDERNDTNSDEDDEDEHVLESSSVGTVTVNIQISAANVIINQTIISNQTADEIMNVFQEQLNSTAKNMTMLYSGNIK